jgi:hypothetical protein
MLPEPGTCKRDTVTRLTPVEIERFAPLLTHGRGPLRPAVEPANQCSLRPGEHRFAHPVKEASPRPYRRRSLGTNRGRPIRSKAQCRLAREAAALTALPPSRQSVMAFATYSCVPLRRAAPSPGMRNGPTHQGAWSSFGSLEAEGRGPQVVEVLGVPATRPVSRRVGDELMHEEDRVDGVMCELRPPRRQRSS